jgi:hypothetical protein
MFSAAPAKRARIAAAGARVSAVGAGSKGEDN